MRKKSFVTEYYLQDAGGQSPYTPRKSHCGGFDNYGLLVTMKALRGLGWSWAPWSHTSGTSPGLFAPMLGGGNSMCTSKNPHTQTQPFHLANSHQRMQIKRQVQVKGESQGLKVNLIAFYKQLRRVDGGRSNSVRRLRSQMISKPTPESCWWLWSGAGAVPVPVPVPVKAAGPGSAGRVMPAGRADFRRSFSWAIILATFPHFFLLSLIDLFKH